MTMTKLITKFQIDLSPINIKLIVPIDGRNELLHKIYSAR